MDTPTKDTTELDDVLGHVKEAEKAVKAQALIKTLARLKELARQVLVNKERTTALLEELGISEADQKRIIDYVNSSIDVTLTVEDKRTIHEEERRSAKKTKISVAAELEERVLDHLTQNSSSAYPVWTTSMTTATPYFNSISGGSFANTTLTRTSLALGDQDNYIEIRI